MVAGYWHTTYWVTDYWHEDYWQDYGTGSSATGYHWNSPFTRVIT